MSTLKIKLDLENPTHTAAAAAFFTTLSGGAVANMTVRDAEQVKGPDLRDMKAKADKPVKNIADGGNTQPKEEKTSPAEVANANASASHEAADWSDDDMRTMKAKDLKAVCDAIGIDYMATDGLNTNAKLRRLILTHFATPGASSQAPKTEAPKTEAPKDAGGSLLDSIKALIPEKAKAGHKDALKAKLTEMGAGRVSELAEASYEAFHSFLVGLTS